MLAELEGSLLEWEENPNDHELVARIFRALHTIKGSGAMFGFDDVADFTHDIETAFDLIRAGSLAISNEIVTMTLGAKDQIKNMIEASDGRGQVDPGRTGEIQAFFRELQASPPVDEPQARDGSGQSPGPVEQDEGSQSTFRIRFQPREEIFLSGAKPVSLLNELRELGEAHIVANLDDIPPLGDYVPDNCYTSWDIILTTTRDVNAVKDVFIFVEDDSFLKIEPISKGAVIEEDDPFHRRLGEILVERGDLEKEALDKVLSGKKLIGEMLVDAGVITADKIESALLEQKTVRELKTRKQETAATTTIRVPSERLDKLVDLVGEMVTVQARLSQATAHMGDSEIRSVAEEVERLTAELRENAMSTRMVPIGSLFNRCRRLVRDLAQGLGKDVEMKTEGEETELDKTVIERINDPLIHLIRNSLDHGIGTPQKRLEAGKPPKGELNISAVHSGANVLIRIRDDGAGIDPRAVREKAVQKGLIEADDPLSEQECFNLIFLPGFSTSEKVTGLSGRGVGMDVVKKNIEALKGAIEVKSEKGVSTEITLKLPLTLAIIDGLLVAVGEEFFVVPVSVIEECVELKQEETSRVRSRKTVTVRGELVPYVRLRERFGINGPRPSIEKVVIGSVGSQRIGLVVDQVIGDHQTVIKSLGPVFKHVTEISGATILGDGSVALILDVQGLAGFRQ